MSRTLSSLAGSASARSERRLAPWVLGIALLAVLAAVGVLFRGQILGLVGLGGDDEKIAAAPQPRELPGRRPQPAAPPPAAGAAPGLTTGLEPASPPEATATPPAAPQQEPEVVEEEPLPEVVQRKPAPEPVGGPAMSAVDRITWEPAARRHRSWSAGATACFQPQSYSQSRMDGPPPRALIRVAGVRRPFSPTRIPVGTPQVRQGAGLGYHEKAGGNELPRRARPRGAGRQGHPDRSGRPTPADSSGGAVKG